MRKRKWNASLGVLLALLTLLMALQPALAATTTIGTDASRPEYFEALGASGNYNPLKTPYHYDRSTGNVAYCLEHKKDSPSSSTEYTDFDAEALWGQNTLRGIQAIVDHGYPNADGGLSEEQAHYATANAIRAWMKESADIGYEFMLVDEGHIHPLPGADAQATWAFFLELLDHARAGDVLSSGGGTVRVSPSHPEWTVQNGQLVARLEVQSSDGYRLSCSHSEVEIDGYFGGTHDVLDLTAPLSLQGEEVQLLLEAEGSAGNGVTLFWYAPESGNDQSVVVAQLEGGSGEGEQVIVSIQSPSLVELTLHKVDASTGEALDGAVFRLLDASGDPVSLVQTAPGAYRAGNGSAEFTTSQGTATVSDLPAGNYTLCEVSPPSAGYAALEPEPLALTASATVTVRNAPTEVEIRKIDALTQEALPGLRFVLVDASGTPVRFSQGSDSVYRPDAAGEADLITDENGYIRIEALPQGIYSVQESAHAGYAALEASPEFALTARAEIRIQNEPLCLRIHKVDAHTGEGLPGISFSLLDESGHPVPLTRIQEGEYRAAAGGADVLITGADGTASVYYLPAGTYTLSELNDEDAGYAGMEPVQVTVEAGNGLSVPASVRLVNEPTALIVSKSDAVTREPLDGAMFRLLDASGTVVRLQEEEPGHYHPDSAGKETFTTHKGEAWVRYLPAGNYTVEEVQAPAGYALDAPKAVSITAENTAAAPARANLQDAPLVLRLRKTDAASGKALDGCTFALHDQNGESIPLREVSDGVYAADASGDPVFTTLAGSATITGLAPGEYTLSEIAPVPGYSKAPDVSVSLTNAHTSAAPAEVTMENHPLLLRVDKVDADTGTALGGAVFRLETAGGEVLRLSPSGSGVWAVNDQGQETFSISASGSAEIRGIPAGEYVLQEVQAPAGYARNPEPISVTIPAATEDPVVITAENHPLAVRVTKTDSFSGKGLPNVRFRIENATGGALRFASVEPGVYRVAQTGDLAIQTGSDGIATILGIREGSYQLVEESNPGFGRIEPVPFTVTAESTLDTPTAIGVENQPLALRILKVDGQTEEPLESVPFFLEKADGTRLSFLQQPDGAWQPASDLPSDATGTETLLTNAEGEILLRYLPAGTYRLVEGEFFGYSMGEPLEVVLTEAHTVEVPLTMTVENFPTALEIRKTDLLTRAPLADVAFAIHDETGTALSFAAGEDGAFHPVAAGESGSATLRTDAQGLLRISHLPQGAYTLHETPLSGYVPLEPIPFEMTGAHTQEIPLRLDVQNLPTRLILEKQDARTKEPLTGAHFALSDESGKRLSFVLQSDGTYHPAASGEKGISEIPVNEEGQILFQYLPAGTYQVTELSAPAGYALAAPIETEVGTETIRHTAEGAQTEDAAGNPFGETSLAVPNQPLALHIRKIHAKTKEPLPGAEFRLKAAGNADVPLRFTLEDGLYLYDPKGTTTTISLDDDCEALLCGLPAGKYLLEESRTPHGFFPIAPVTCSVEAQHTLLAPLEVTVANAPEVKLGMDTDKYNVIIALLLTAVLSAAAISSALWLRRRSKR